jgi:hypothetical protein
VGGVAMRKVCGSKFYSIRDILKNGGFIYPTSNWSLKRYEVPELKLVAILENTYKRRAWIYEIDGKAFLIIYETEPFNNHAQYQIVVEKGDDAFVLPIKLGFVKLFENQVLTIENAERVSLFIGRLLKKDWLVRFTSGSQDHYVRKSRRGRLYMT